MKYYYDDGKSESYIQLVVSHIDSDGDTILKEFGDSEIVIPASEYIEEVYEEMMTSGEDIFVCAERVRNIYFNTHIDHDVVFETATDEEIAKYILDDYSANAEDRGREEMTIEDVRIALQ
jgi:hypothetical protein